MENILLFVALFLVVLPGCCLLVGGFRVGT